ncbi:MAG: hypothetical protein AAGE94_00815 [Acidobacteriota bacterium]
MPIKIYRVTPDGEQNQEVAWLCDDGWLLGDQVAELTRWVREVGSTLPPDEYVADIGFCWRQSAGGGGPVIEAPMLRRMSDMGLSLCFSEYPGFAEETNDEESEA